MKKILSFIENHTRGKCYKSFKYCLESVEVPTIVYDDKQNIIFKSDKTGETDKGIKTYKSLYDLAKRISIESKPLFKYFLDGSRRTYKVDDIAYNNRLYPIIAGQIGVGCCERPSSNSLKSLELEKQLVLSLPDCADKDDRKDLFFNSLLHKLNEQSYIKKHGIFFHKILNYSDRELKLGEKYEHRGIATIQDQMIEAEKSLVMKLVKERKLNFESYLLKDGSLEYQKMKKGNYRDLSAIKTNYQCVIGASKSFNPELCKDNRGKSIAKHIADLPLFHRTPAFKYTTDRTPDVYFSVWYLRIREACKTSGPFDGVLKIEKILVSEDEQERGLSSDEIDLISANLINERNPTCYGADRRWANHLYPVYLTEKFIKSQYLSELYFLNLF